MRDLLTRFLIVSALFVSLSSPRANAGLLIAYVANPEVSNESGNDALLIAGGVVFIGTPVLSGLVYLVATDAAKYPASCNLGCLDIGAAHGVWGQIFKISAGILVLGVDGSLPVDTLKHSLNENYPYIDNPEVVNELAQMIKQEASRSTEVEGQKMVIISPEVTKRILAPAAQLSQQQVEKIVNDLK